jgi:hypothetical protein
VRSQVSADSINPTATQVRFGNLNATYTTAFATFSGEKLFSPLASNEVDLIFYGVGLANRATVDGVGAVFVDVDLDATTRLQIFDTQGAMISNAAVPAFPGNGGLSFVGLAVSPPCRIARAHLILGDATIGPNDISQAGADDIVVLDDLIYGEPQDMVFFDDFELLRDTSLWN